MFQLLLAVAFSVFAGAICDAPAVEDAVRFDSSCRIGPLLGGSLGLPGPGRLRLEAEGAYARPSFESSAFVTDTPVRADFLELAFLGAWPIHESRALRLSAVFGPQVGVRLGARRRFREVDQDVTDELEPADFKIQGGVRLSHRTGRGEIFVQGRISWGLTDLDDTNQQRIHSRVLGILFGYSR